MKSVIEVFIVVVDVAIGDVVSALRIFLQLNDIVRATRRYAPAPQMHSSENRGVIFL